MNNESPNGLINISTSPATRREFLGKLTKTLIGGGGLIGGVGIPLSALACPTGQANTCSSGNNCTTGYEVCTTFNVCDPNTCTATNQC